MSHGSLATTGAGIAIGGIVFDQAWILVAAVALVVGGAFAIRAGFRRGKPANEI